MAYLNEFPKWDSNGRNLDWLLEQYSTFEKRLQEIRDEFTETVTRLEGDIDDLENAYQRELDLFEGRINTLLGEITRKVDSINENIGGYVNEYLTENINTILQDNPVLETKYERIGTIQSHSTITINLTQNKMYDIMTLNYAFDMHKLLVSNDTYKFYVRPYVDTLLINNVNASEGMVPGTPPTSVLVPPLNVGTETVAVPVLNAVTASINNLVLTLTNNTDNVLTVYKKELI